jgi:hypothetical protein
MSKTPITDAIERTRINLTAQRTPAYGDMMACSRRLENALNECRNILTEIAFGFRRPSKRGGGPGNIGMGAHDMQQIASQCLSELSHEFPEPEINE